MRYGYIIFIIIFSLFGFQCDLIMNSGDNRMLVQLQNQADHSGIMIRLLELNTFTITDSLGHFEFKNVPDGNYTLQAKYPYFLTEQMGVNIKGGKIQTTIKIVLKQQLKFWVEPAETIISLNDPSVNEIERWRVYYKNISEKSILMGTAFDPLYPWALVPKGFNWPFVANPDGRPEYCYEHYGWLGSTDAIVDFRITIQPGEIQSALVGSTTLSKDCVKEGTYLFYSLINDMIHYPEYFEPAYFWTDTLPHPQPYNPLNKSLIKKQDLFRPATINITTTI
jgi:hypothetical protein